MIWDLFFTGPLCFKIPSNIQKLGLIHQIQYIFQVQLIFSVPENYDQNPHIYSFFYWYFLTACPNGVEVMR